MIGRFMGDFDYLSNFHPWFCEYDGVIYPTAEHAFQAAKTLDQGARANIYMAKTAKIAKRLGRQVELRPDWDSYREEAMLEILRSKFNMNKDRKMYLLATGSHDLVEGNYWHDNFWGKCWCRPCQKYEQHNKLGILLMKVREEIFHGLHY